VSSSAILGTMLPKMKRYLSQILSTTDMRAVIKNPGKTNYVVITNAQPTVVRIQLKLVIMVSSLLFIVV
jgi:hypothetical protein